MKRAVAILMAILVLISAAGCAGTANTYAYKSADGDWQVRIPKEFVKDKESKDDQLKSTTVEFRNDSETTLVLHELEDKDTVVGPDTIKKEIGDDHYIHIEKEDVIEHKTLGKIYGAHVHDDATQMVMIYYRFRHKDKIISVLGYKNSEYTEQEESQFRDLIQGIKVN